MLLAVVFENYKSRILLRADTKSKKRLAYILTYYERYDDQLKGFLSLTEAK